MESAGERTMYDRGTITLAGCPGRAHYVYVSPEHKIDTHLVIGHLHNAIEALEQGKFALAEGDVAIAFAKLMEYNQQEKR